MLFYIGQFILQICEPALLMAPISQAPNIDCTKEFIVPKQSLF